VPERGERKGGNNMKPWRFLLAMVIAIHAPCQIELQLTSGSPQKEPHVPSKLITNCIGWVRPYYVWRNKNTILIFRGDENYGILNGLEEYHLDSGKHDSLDVLNRRWRHNPLWLPLSRPEEKLPEQIRQDQRGGVVWASVSPDGKWIVWLAGRPNVGGAPLIWMTISLDGKHWTERGINRLSGEPDRIDSIAWSHDSPSWIGLLNNTDPSAGLIYDVYTQAERRVDFSSPATLPKGEYRFWSLLAQRSNGHFLLISLRQGYQFNNDVLFADIPPEREKGAPKQWAIHVPSNAFAKEVALSPLGDRLIWNLVFVASKESPNQPRPEAQLKWMRSEIWLSKLDGSGMQRLGDLVFNLLDSEDSYESAAKNLVRLQWSPDGKHISYIYDRKLYIVDMP
jgi:hypothetical protein